MATFVLVHGAWHGSWCWQRVRRKLQAAGHEVFTPTLTGVGDRSHLNSPQVTLETHIKDVENLIRWEDLSDVILVGHSYGGMVVTGVADRLPDRIRALIYLDAFVPDDGDSLISLLPDNQRVQILEGTNATGEGWKVPPIPAEVFAVNEADCTWVDGQCTMQSLATFSEPIRLTGGVDRIADVTYVLASRFEMDSPFPPFMEKATAKGWKIGVLPCGHDVMIDMPGEVTELLLDAAG
jgi:pimeloyl-ACP methyl ester carboxylesterase